MSSFGRWYSYGLAASAIPTASMGGLLNRRWPKRAGAIAWSAPARTGGQAPAVAAVDSEAPRTAAAFLTSFGATQKIAP